MRLLVTAVLAATAFAVPATASHPAPVCNLVVDPVGDVQPYDAALDIVSADVASGVNTVVGVVRLRSTASGLTLSASGARWDFRFAVDGAAYTFQARRDALGGYTATVLRNGTAAGPVALVVTGTEIRWTVPRGLILSGSGAVFAGLGAATYATPLDLTEDVTFSAATYTDGTPSCVKAA